MKIGNENWKWLSKIDAVAVLDFVHFGISILVPRGGLDHLLNNFLTFITAHV